jgi:uncharacterized protein Smg (DUF494 family)
MENTNSPFDIEALEKRLKELKSQNQDEQDILDYLKELEEEKENLHIALEHIRSTKRTMEYPAQKPAKKENSSVGSLKYLFSRKILVIKSDLA